MQQHYMISQIYHDNDVLRYKLVKTYCKNQFQNIALDWTLAYIYCYGLIASASWIMIVSGNDLSRCPFLLWINFNSSMDK